METITILHNQSLFDIAIQHTGSAENCFEIAVANGMAVSDRLRAGSILIIPGTLKNDTDILNYYTSKKIMPATALTRADNDLVSQHKRGIGFMQITSGNAESIGFIIS